jgi:hypothetical protein
VKGRKRRFTADEIAHIKALYHDPIRRLSADSIAKLFRCSAGTVLRAADGRLKPLLDKSTGNG